MTHPAVSLRAVYGVLHESMGEGVKAAWGYEQIPTPAPTS